MTPETIAYILHLLDTQYQHIATQRLKSNAAGEKQRVYYCGLLNGANLVFSEVYTANRMITVDANGKHQLLDREGEATA